MKKLPFLSILITIFFSGYLAATASLEDLDFMTEDYPPYNFTDDENIATGLAVDTLIEVFSQLKIKKERKDIHIYPWARGYALVQTPKLKNVLFSMARNPARESLFKWVGPLTTVEQVIFTNKNSSIVINSKEDLLKYNYAVVRGDIAGIKLTEAGVANDNITSLNEFKQLVNNVQWKRVDAFVYGKDTAIWLMKQNKFNPKDFKIIYTFQPIDKTYLAFNLSIDDKTVQAYQQAVDNVIQDEKLMQKIKDKYLK